MYALPKGRYIHGTMEKFTARKYCKLGAVFQKHSTCFKSKPASPDSRTNLLPSEFPNPPPTALLGRLQSSHCTQPAIAPQSPTSSSIWSQAFLSTDYFKWAFNATVESLSQRVG